MAKVTFEDMKKMNREQLQDTLKGNLTAVQRQQATKLLTDMDAPVETPAEKPEGAAEGSQADAAAPVATEEKKAKNKPNETTRTIEHFTDDTKGLRVGDLVSFHSTNKVGSPKVQGTIQRIFRFVDESLDREEAKLKGLDGKRYYRFESGLEKVVAETPSADAAPAVESQTEGTAAPEASQAEETRA